MKEHPLLIENVGEDVYMVMSRGHHNFDKFMQAVRENYDWPLGYPEHLWVKATPDSTGNRNCLYHFVNSNVRGSFPVTFSTEAYGDCAYEVIKESLESQYERI